MRLLARFLNSLFPDACVGCQARGLLLCDSCAKKLAPARAPTHSFVTSVFSYHDFRVKRLIWLLKYRNKRHVAEVFASHLSQAATEFLGEEHSFLGARKIILVPVPLSKKREAKRGYNQALLLARAILAQMPNETISIEPKLLKKNRETQPQADIRKKSERLSNLGDCFEVVSGRKGDGEVIILIDDVTTTGATLNAARNALRVAGFTKVYALTIAH